MLILKNVIEKNQWDNIERLFDQLDGVDGKTTAGDKIKHLKQSTIYTNKIISKAIFTKNVINTIGQSIHGYKKANVRLSTYKKGDFYHWHVDSQHGKFSSEINSISYTIFLNNPSEYIGGELEVKSEHGVNSFKLNKGDMLLYPSDYLHRVKEVTKGVRQVALGWINPLIPNEKDRYTLTEINNIQDLITNVANNLEDCEEKDMLLKAYEKMHYVRVQFNRKCYHSL